MKKEESLQVAISKYLKLQYPNVVFTSESSGIRLTIGQAKKAKQQRSNHKLPDMIILEPNYLYEGICLELKKHSPYLKNGELSKNKHVQEQNKTLQLLSDKGYLAMFVWDFDYFKEMFDNYMLLKGKRGHYELFKGMP